MKDVYSLTIGEDKRMYNWHVTLLALQGIANRIRPTVYLDVRDLADWIQADRLRRRINERQYGIRCRLLKTRASLLKHTRDCIRGVVLYDPKLDATRWMAVTLAGLEDLLPVTTDQMKEVPSELEVKHDLRGRWNDDVSAYRWGIRELLPRCNSRIAYNAGYSHDHVDMGVDLGVITSLDYVVGQRGFVFNLSPSAGPGSFADHTIPGYPGDVRLFKRILSRLDVPAAIYGWAEPEWTLTTLLNRYDHYLMCGRAANLSFHAAMVPNVKRRTFRQSPAGKMPRLEKKCYIAFMTSEGDTSRVTSSFFMGGWQSRNRGKIPVNWGLNPMEATCMPAHVEYFYDTATPNDYLYSGVGGAGYVFVNCLRHPEPYIAHAARHLKPAGLDVVEIWQNGRPAYEVYEQYARRCGLRGIVHLPQGPVHVHGLPSGVPIVFMDEKLVHNEGSLVDIADRIRFLAGQYPLPLFVPVYRSPRPDTPEQFQEIARQLDPAIFQPVRLDVMMHLAKASLES